MAIPVDTFTLCIIPVVFLVEKEHWDAGLCTCLCPWKCFCHARVARRDTPLEPLKSWTKTAPPAARYVDKQSKFAPKAPVKPGIKKFLADSAGTTPMEIDPSKISAMNTSTYSESEIYHEALEDALSIPIEPTMYHQAVPTEFKQYPNFSDYSSMFDLMVLQQLQEN
eukprot:scaffold139809_cov58-Attheya_sp.AAC.2